VDFFGGIDGATDVAIPMRAANIVVVGAARNGATTGVGCGRPLKSRTAATASRWL